MITEPKVAYRDKKPYVGICTVTPFQVMFAVVDTLLKELCAWVKQYGVADRYRSFFATKSST